MNDIELMHSYSEFPNDVIISFQSLITEYKLEVKIHGICSVDLQNRYCLINFNMDRYDLQALLYKRSGFIFRKTDKLSFSIFQVADTVNPNHNLDDSFPKTSYGDKTSIKNLLNWYATLIQKCLTPVLLGSFSWYNKLKEAELVQNNQHH